MEDDASQPPEIRSRPSFRRDLGRFARRRAPGPRARFRLELADLAAQPPAQPRLSPGPRDGGGLDAIAYGGQWGYGGYFYGTGISVDRWGSLRDGPGERVPPGWSFAAAGYFDFFLFAGAIARAGLELGPGGAHPLGAFSLWLGFPVLERPLLVRPRLEGGIHSAQRGWGWALALDFFVSGLR